MKTLCSLLALCLLASSPAAAQQWPATPPTDGIVLTTYVGLPLVPPKDPLGAPAHDGQLQANLLSALIEANPFDVPETWVQTNYDLIVAELTAQRGGQPLELTEAQQADLRVRAAFAAKSGMLLDAIAKKEGIQASDADLEARYAQIAAERRLPVEAVRAAFTEDAEELRLRLVEEKTIAWLLERAVVQR